MDAPFDRGEVDRASLDATERLRARLSSRPVAPPARPVRGFLPWAIAGALFVFVAGMIANPWFEAQVRNKLPFTAAVTSKPADNAEIAVLRQQLARLETPAAPPPSERLARTEAKIETSSDQIARDAERIDRLTAEIATLSARHEADRARTEAANANAVAAAERAQAMLTLVLVRRAVDAGQPLGPLDAALRRAFDASQPDAVKAVAALGTAPVSLASLRRGFNTMRPIIGARPTADQRQSWWETLTTTISAAVSSPAPGSPLAAPETANAALARGDYVAAANHLRRLPAPRPQALANWLAAADRLHAGNQALAMLESTALLAQPVVTPDAVAPEKPVSSPVPAVPVTRTNTKVDQTVIGGRIGRIGDIVGNALDLRPRLSEIFGFQRVPNKALPTRTWVAPSITAVS